MRPAVRPMPGGCSAAVTTALVLNDMDAELAALESRRDKTCALEQAMMRGLLIGRTRPV